MDIGLSVTNGLWPSGKEIWEVSIKIKAKAVSTLWEHAVV
jgi:hypothetical protein